VALGVGVAETEGVVPPLEPFLGSSPLLQLLSARTEAARTDIAERRRRPELKIREVMR
jgi:hypothetical protein